ncbi:uncharacterized protein LOC126899687 [Daktulosphaira vitifoliae]|uniref:uncharacterized protein LOC126899687 n=1 Tax=Daktulosphaira vitifoliae TaxID=58002 RepID=UPI0021A9E716|nr:uncharacterized protein LOC126899687 [Daktulosphaira vitifoliae]
MIFTKYICFFFFLNLVKSNDPIQQSKQNLLTCFQNYGLDNKEIINSQNKFTRKFETFLLNRSIDILRCDDYDEINDVANTLFKYIFQRGQHGNMLRNCCLLYANELTNLKKNKDLIEPYENLVRDWSKENKVLPTVLREDNMTIDEGYELGDTSQIIVLANDTEDTDRIKLDRYN